MNEVWVPGECASLRFVRPGPGIAVLLVLFVVSSTIGSLAPPARAGSGGPDTYGYTWVDSKPVAGVAYGWVDGVTGGTDLLLTDEDCTLNRVPFQFPFRFYGVIYNDAYVCANGFIAFNIPDSYPWFIDAYAAAFGYDLDPGAISSGHVFVLADTASSPRRFIVTWNDVFIYGTTDPQKFEIVLTEEPGGQDGKILFQYQTLTNPPPDPLVGIDSLGSTSNLYYTSALESSLAILFLPPGAPPQGDTLVVRGNPLAPLTVEPGRKEVPFLVLNMSTQTNSVNLRRLRVDVTGITSAPGDVARISLWRDGDGDGLLNKSFDPLLVSATPAGSPESASLTLPAPLVITAGAGTNLLVSFDVSLGATVGDWLGAGVITAAYVTVDSPDNVSAANFPLNTYLPGVRTHVVEGVDTLQVTSWSALNPANVSQWETDVPILSTTLDADKGAVTVTEVGLEFLGSRSGDVYLAKVFEDMNRDGALQPASDRLLSRGPFDGTGSLAFTMSLQVIAGTSRSLIVAFDVAPDAIPGDLVGARIVGAANVTVQGTADGVASTNFPIATGTLSTVAAGSPPVIASRWAVTPPTPDGQIATGEYVLSSGNSKSLSAIAGNSVATLLVAQNDPDYLYLAYDATGDTTSGVNDSASVAFRTNRTSYPLAPSDDQYGVGGPMGPFHAVWNDTTAMWTIEDACNPTVDVNHTGLVCSIGFDRSPQSSTSHRIYEFRIPLRLLEVPLPIPVGYSLGFAAGSNWSRGIENRDALRNSSWPLADPAVPPAWYGVLTLADAPPVNSTPRLDWTGEPGFTGDGVAPDRGTTLDAYEFRIKYTDIGGEPPALGDPSLHVLAGGSEIAGSPFSMVEADPGDTSVADGKIYRIVRTFSGCPQVLSYFFTSWDDTGANATPTPELTGPIVDCPPAAPQLANGSVSPTQGYVDVTNFTWTVEYRDADGDPPARIELTVLKAGSPVTILPLSLLAWLSSPNDYVAGARFGATRNLTAAGADYTFSFLANDSLLETTTAPADGPTVLTEPADLLQVTPSDTAPIDADAGQRNVRMFLVALQASANAVSLTSIRVDRVGSSFDTDVAMVRLYRDVDSDGFPSGPDIVLGQGTFSSARIVFTGFRIDINAGSPVQLIAVVDVAQNAIADNTVALRILGASYFQVLSPDIVAPFTPFASGAILVNRAPSAIDLTADNAADGTPAVLHLTNPQPRLAWTYSDPNTNDVVQVRFNVSLFRTTGGFLWASNSSGSTSSVVYGGAPLSDGATYRMEVQVFDGRLWGVPSTLTLRLNTPPPAPALIGPPDNAINQGPNTITLQWGAVQDGEGDSARYRWTLATRADFVGAVANITALGATSVIVPTAGATRYYWKLEAHDGYEWGSPSATWSFTTQATAGRVSGRVVSGGFGLLAVVQIFDGSGNLVQSATTSASGTGAFAFTDVPFGVYQVRVSSQGYQGRTIAGVVLDQANPVQDLGDIELIQTSSGAIDWMTIALFGIAIGGIVAGISIAVALALRRRRAASRAPPQVATPAAPAPAITGPSVPAAATEAYVFECPACGTVVGEDATSCPGCGAVFE